MRDSLSARGAHALLIIAGVALGIAMGFKLVCTVFILGSGIALFFTERNWRSMLITLALFGVACFVGLLIWGVFASVLTGTASSLLHSKDTINKI